MKKIYYFPGLISAALIPLLFWYYGNQKFEEINLNVIDIWLPPKAKIGEKRSYLIFEPYRNWNYKKIKIAPHTAKENTKLYVAEIKNLQKRNEKNSGIEFIIDDSNTYDDFVSLLNDLAIAQQDQFAVDTEKTGHIFAVHSYIDPLKKDCNDNTLIDSGVVNNWAAYLRYIEPKGYDQFTDILTKLPKQSFYIIFGFLFLVNMSMLSIKERFQASY